jgi:pentatricopeptide repeat protein
MVPLSGIVGSMQKLGKSTDAILREFRTALECNEGLFSTDAVQTLLESLKKDGQHEELLSGLTKLFDASGVQSATSKRSPKSVLASFEGALKGNRLNEALAHLDRLAGRREKSDFTPPSELMTRLLALAGRQHRLVELAPRLMEFQLALEPRMLNELLQEANRRRDAVFCREVYRFAADAKVPKNTQTYELLVQGLALDSMLVQALFEEAVADTDIQVTESLAIALLKACAAGRDVKLAGRVFEAVSPTYGDAPDHTLYAALLQVYSVCEMHDTVCDIYEKEMAPRNIKPDSQIGDIIMRSAMQSGRNSLAQSVFAGASGDTNKHIAMIKACSRERDLQGALDVFERLKSSGTSLNSMAYNSLLDACIQCNDATEAQKLFEQMKSVGSFDVVSFNIMLKMYLREQKRDEAQHLLKEMREHGLQPNKITYNELINARVEAKDRNGVWQLLAEMKNEGEAPNSVTCAILLKALNQRASKQDVSKTMALVDQMEDPMDEVLFSSVIEACLRVGQLDLLSRQMQKYARQGGLIGLSAPTYGSMIKAYGQARDIERMWELWHEMEKRQVKATAVTIGCMIDALVKNGCVEDAWNLVHDLLSDPARKALVNNIMYSTILKGFAMTKQTERLFAVYAEIHNQGVQANTITYNTMIDACARCGAMNRVPQLLADMKAANISPDQITYGTLVKGHCLSGSVDQAFEILAEMRAGGKHKPDEILYNCLLDGCAKEHRLEDAMTLYAEMKQANVVPSNFTLCTLVKLLGRSRRLDQAFAIVEELSEKNGLKPNIQVFTCLIQACIHNRQLQRALELHDEVIAEECEPDQKTYNVLVRGCMWAGNLQKAVEMVRCAYLLPGHSFQMASRAYGVEAKVLEELVMKLNQGGQSDSALGRGLLLDLKQHHGINVQDNVYSQVVCEATRSQAPRIQSQGYYAQKRW